MSSNHSIFLYRVKISEFQNFLYADPSAGRGYTNRHVQKISDTYTYAEN